MPSTEVHHVGSHDIAEIDMYVFCGSGSFPKFIGAKPKQPTSADPILVHQIRRMC